MNKEADVVRTRCCCFSIFLVWVWAAVLVHVASFVFYRKHNKMRAQSTQQQKQRCLIWHQTRTSKSQFHPFFAYPTSSKIYFLSFDKHKIIPMTDETMAQFLFRQKKNIYHLDPFWAGLATSGVLWLKEIVICGLNRSTHWLFSLLAVAVVVVVNCVFCCVSSDAWINWVKMFAQRKTMGI